MTARVEVRLQATADLFLGTGHGSGFSRASANFVPASTFLGAVVGRYRASHPGVNDAHLESLLRQVTSSDAAYVAGGSARFDWSEVALPLDRMPCKYPTVDCPATGWQWWQVPDGRCPNGCAVEPAKGERMAPKVRITRVALDASEQAVDDQLFQRQALDARQGELVCWVEGPPDALRELGLTEGALLRLGGARSVAGRASVTSVRPLTGRTDQAVNGFLRVELLTPGVYVDDFGFPSPTPAPADVQHSLGLSDAKVVRSFIRWGTVGGWSVAASVPKPEDPAVIPHSVFLVEVPVGADVPAVVSDLGLRTFEGCGWARVESLTGDAAQALSAEEVSV